MRAVVKNVDLDRVGEGKRSESDREVVTTEPVFTLLPSMLVLGCNLFEFVVLCEEGGSQRYAFDCRHKSSKVPNIILGIMVY